VLLASERIARIGESFVPIRAMGRWQAVTQPLHSGAQPDRRQVDMAMNIILRLALQGGLSGLNSRHSRQQTSI